MKNLQQFFIPYVYIHTEARRCIEFKLLSFENYHIISSHYDYKLSPHQKSLHVMLIILE